MRAETCKSYTDKMAFLLEGVHRDYIPLMLTLKHFEEQDAQASGLLGKMLNLLQIAKLLTKKNC